MDLEVIDYDVEGAAYRDGVVVDGAYLLATVRRRVVVDDPALPPEQRKIVSPPGEAVRLRLDLAALSSAQRAALFAAFGALEAIVKDHATTHFVSQTSDQTALDARIDAAARADRAREQAQED